MDKHPPFRMPSMDPCYFCEIISGTTDQWNVIERTALTITLLNGRQFEVGQCMVVPNRHAPTLFDLTSQEDLAIMQAARRASAAFIKAFAPDGVLLYQNNGSGSGQEVPHYHLHVVPRQPNSNWGLGPPHIARLENRPAHLDHAVVTDAKRATVAKLRTFLGSL
jgi:diadenosine tetraphosphate (Ap4A) HIT family hydrolase